MRQASQLERRMRGFYNASEVYQNLLKGEGFSYRKLALEQYASIVTQYSLRRGIVLDLGCGTGETTKILAGKGCDTVGLDISTLFLKPHDAASSELNPRFVVGDVARLPFRSRSVSCVCMHDVIEHVPDTDQLLCEIIRVLRADGRVIIASPNLLSPFRPIRHILGSAGFNTGFYGSYLRAFGAVFSNLYLLIKKLLAGQPEFTYRVPLLGNDFQCPDDDAVYMANVVDLKKWFQREGFTAGCFQFLPQKDSVSDRLKSQVLHWFPCLDKGFCLVAQRSGVTQNED